MNNLTLPAPPVLLGSQTPRLCSYPEGAQSTVGEDAIDLAAVSGLALDPWQQLVLRQSMAENEFGKWLAWQVLLIVCRQNGKNAVIEARELAGMFLLPERLIVHTAHLFDTSMDAMRRLLERIEETPDLDRQVKRVSRSHGEEGIELKNRSRIRFKTRTAAGGRGLTGDLVILDEAMILPDTTVGTLIPTLRAVPNPQVWFTGSAVDQDSHEHGMVMTRLRNRGIRGGSRSLCYMEWSSPGSHDPADAGADVDLTDRAHWAAANPGLGIRIQPEHMADELEAMPRKQFMVELLGIGDWPAEEVADVERALNADHFATLADQDPVLTNTRAIAVDMSPDRRWVSVAAATITREDKVHVEVGYHGKPGRHVLQLLLDLVAKWDPCAVVIDRTGAASSMVSDLLAAGIEPSTTSSTEMAQACGSMADDVGDELVSFTGDPLIVDAVKATTWRKLSGAKAFTSVAGGVISPWVACTLARYGVRTFYQPPKPPPPTPVTAGGGGRDEFASVGVDNLMNTGF